MAGSAAHALGRSGTANCAGSRADRADVGLDGLMVSAVLNHELTQTHAYRPFELCSVEVDFQIDAPSIKARARHVVREVLEGHAAHRAVQEVAPDKYHGTRCTRSKR